jgi:TonB family protein
MAVLLIALIFVGIKVFTHSNPASSPANTSAEQPSVVPAPPVSSRPASNDRDTKPVKTSSDAVVRQVIPEVSKSARNTIQGKIQVKVRVDVDPSGKVKSARLVSPGPSKYFAGLALKAAQQWEFSPPEGPDQNHSRSWILRFLFGRASTQVIPIREHA